MSLSMPWPRLDGVHVEVAAAGGGRDDLADDERAGHETEQAGVTCVRAVVAQHEVVALRNGRTRDRGRADLAERHVVPTRLVEDLPVDVDALAHRPDRLTRHPDRPGNDVAGGTPGSLRL